MGDESCANDLEFKTNEVEEGELEDGELDENADDNRCKTIDTNTYSDKITDDKVIKSNSKESHSSKTHHDRKKKSKKRRRDDLEKTHDIPYNNHSKTAQEYDMSYSCNQWNEGENRPSKRWSRNKLPPGPYDSPESCNEEYVSEAWTDDHYQRQHQYPPKNDDEGYSHSPRNKKHGGDKHGSSYREKKLTIPRGYGDNDGHFDEQQNIADYNDRGRDSHKSGHHKSSKHSSGKKRKFESSTLDRAPVCKFFLEGNCIKGDECSFSHSIHPFRKQEVCRYYLAGGCRKSSCLYYHDDWPCREFHTKGMCEDGDQCKFSHKELNEETEGLLSLSDVSGDCYGIKSASNEKFHQPQGEKRKIPSLLDMEIFPPGHVPKRPSPPFRKSGRGFARSHARSFVRGQRRGCLSKVPFEPSHFGIYDLKIYPKDPVKQENMQGHGWERKPYSTNWRKRNDYNEEWNEMNEEDPYREEYDYSADNDDRFEDNLTKDPDYRATDENCFNRYDDAIESNAEQISDNPHSVGQTKRGIIEESEGNLNPDLIQDSCEEDDISKNLKYLKDQNKNNTCSVSPSQILNVQQPTPPFQNPLIGNPQVNSMLNMLSPMLRIPPPNVHQGIGLSVQSNLLGGLGRPGAVSSSQLGILGAPPLRTPILPPPIQGGMNHNIMPHQMQQIGLQHQQGVQPPQVLNQFISPQQQPLGGILGRGPGGIFPSSIPHMNNQSFVQMPPFPPPRFDLSQIITNIVRNSAAAALSGQPPMFMMNPSVPIPTPVNNPTYISQNFPKDISMNEANTGDAESTNNNNPTNIKLGTDPRLKNKDESPEKPEQTEGPTVEPEETEVHKPERTVEVEVLEIDGTSKTIAYILKPITLDNCKPSVPAEVLANFKQDISTFEDPRLKKYSRSLSDFTCDASNRLSDPRSHRAPPTPTISSEFSSPILLSPTDSISSANKSKPYSLPDIFIPPTSAPNIELEDKILATNRTKSRKASGPPPLFSPLSDVKDPLTNLINQPEFQIPEALMECNAPVAGRSVDGNNTKSHEKGTKRVIDYRNDPRFKKKKTRTKSEESKEEEKSNESEMTSFPISPISTSSEKDRFNMSFIDKTQVPRIPSPIPTFPLYCTTSGPSTLFSSSSVDDLEDMENVSTGMSTPTKEDNSAPEFEHETEDFPTQSSPSPVPFYPEQGDQSPVTINEINLKDMFKTIDPTTSPFC